jgi:hypothetical protein
MIHAVMVGPPAPPVKQISLAADTNWMGMGLKRVGTWTRLNHLCYTGISAQHQDEMGKYYKTMNLPIDLYGEPVLRKYCLPLAPGRYKPFSVQRGSEPMAASR